MPRISTDNYDTVASWNGSQDLFIVEQPDGTKVATPAMVKQFMEAGDFVATGEVEDGHGNMLKDMAKSADVVVALAGKQDILTFDNTPTANSNNPVKSGGVKTYVDNAVKEYSGVITLNSGWNFDGGVVNTVRKFGNVAWISSYIYSTNALTAGTLYDVGTLPTGFIPLKNCVIPIYGSDSSTLNGVVTIGIDGKIKYKAVNTGRYAIYTTVMYPLS